MILRILSERSRLDTHNYLQTVALAICAYVLIVGSFLLLWNWHGGGMIQQWHEEYFLTGVLSGSGKWRTDEGKTFCRMALLFGIWVYPGAFFAQVFLLRRAWMSSTIIQRGVYGLGAAGCFYILFRFISLGVFRAVTAG